MGNKTPMIMMLIFCTFMIGKILYTSTNTNRKISENYPEKFDEAEDYSDSLFIVKAIPDTFTIRNNFDYVYDRFNVFNSELDTSTVVKFNEVCEFYGLDSTVKMLEWCVGQILLESGAKQYYEASHPKEGQLVESYSGAVGISQIMPVTAHGYLTKRISKSDAEYMIELGAKPFGFINDSTSTKSECIDMTRGWLMNETNNIILWGFIMRSKLDRRPNMLKVLVSYNAGTTGMIKYVDTGGVLSNHKYVKGIQTKLNYAEEKIDLVPS
jgi:hypothetical protein